MPTEHPRHVVDPGSCAYFPAAHCVHASRFWDAENEPGGQAPHCRLRPNTVLEHCKVTFSPALQFLQGRHSRSEVAEHAFDM